MNKLVNFIFSLRKPKLVILAGSGKEIVQQVLKPRFKTTKDVLVIESNLENIEEIKFLIKNSSLPVLALNQTSDVSFEKIKTLVQAMPSQGFLILNFNEEVIGKIKELGFLSFLTFGFDEKADFYASDVKINGGTNFKINYKGNSVPIWLEQSRGEEQIPGVLATAAAATIFGLNLVEVSEALKTPDPPSSFDFGRASKN
jgi:hypothetical protein